MGKRGDWSWGVFYVFTLGIVILMIGVRPELQPTLRDPVAPGPWIELVGHIVTWSAATVLVVRLILGTRSHIRGGAPPGGV